MELHEGRSKGSLELDTEKDSHDDMMERLTISDIFVSGSHKLHSFFKYVALESVWAETRRQAEKQRNALPLNYCICAVPALYLFAATDWLVEKRFE